MERERQEYLSAEELRNRLYHNLRDRGLFDSIKVNAPCFVTQLFSVWKLPETKCILTWNMFTPVSSLIARISSTFVIMLTVFNPELPIVKTKLLNRIWIPLNSLYLKALPVFGFSPMQIHTSMLIQVLVYS